MKGGESLYDVLGVPEDADGATLRRVYQKLARRYHPDLHPGDREAQERFEEIARAYSVLSDPDLRRRYDLYGEVDEALLAATTLLEVEREPRDDGGGQSFEEILAAVAGPPVSGEGGGAGRDLSAELTLDFAEAVRGVVTSFSVQQELMCEVCGGGGESAGEGCSACAGRGKRVELERLRVRVPCGVENGGRIRVPGRGSPDSRGRRGDLYITLRVRPHSHFRRRGLDIHTELPVTVAEAALGADVEVPTLDGPVQVRLPAGVAGGQRFRLKGRGVETADGRRGDHYYSVSIRVPHPVDERVRRLLEELPRHDPRRDLPRRPV